MGKQMTKITNCSGSSTNKSDKKNACAYFHPYEYMKFSTPGVLFFEAFPFFRPVET